MWLSTSAMPPTTRQQNQSAYDRLQAELDQLRTANESLKRENSALKGHNTRLKQQKASVESSEQEARDAERKQCRLTEALTKKLNKAKEQYKQNLEEEARTHDEELEAEQEKYKVLSDQNVKLKQKVAASSRLDNQITDEIFREAMSSAFVAIHDCFHGVTRRQKFNIDISLAGWEEELEKYLPDHKDNTSKDRLHLCIAAVAWVVVTTVNTEMVFGYPSTELIEAATACWEKMPEPGHPKARKKITQWLSLTREILTDKDQKSMNDAIGFILEDVLDRSHELLEGLTDLKFNDNIRKELSEALEPFLPVMCMLPYQRWQYKFEMIPTFDENYWTSFNPAEMESMFVAENTGWLKASLFPQLCRLEWDEHHENFKRTVICKARVAVKSHPPTMKYAVGEPMNEDPKIDVLRAGSRDYIDLSESPERGFPESGIPDSFDRAEEVTIVQSRRWPA